MGGRAVGRLAAVPASSGSGLAHRAVEEVRQDQQRCSEGTPAGCLRHMRMCGKERLGQDLGSRLMFGLDPRRELTWGLFHVRFAH